MTSNLPRRFDRHRRTMAAATVARLRAAPTDRTLDELIEAAAVAAKRSRDAISGQGFHRIRWCETCASYHRATFRWRDRERAWHDVLEDDVSAATLRELYG